MPKYCFDWFFGASGQLEVMSPTGNFPCRFRYTPPFRGTLRSPLEDTTLNTSDDLDPIYTKLDELMKCLSVEAARKPGCPPAVAGIAPAAAAAGAAPALTPAATADPGLQTLGDMLLTLIFPQKVYSQLQTQDLYLEIGTDEDLLNLPWELMFDGTDFLCLKNFVGRFVNLSIPRMLSSARPANVYGVDLDRLNVLVISVPKPAARKDKGGAIIEYEELEGARAETDAIQETLLKFPNVNPVVLTDATWDDVWNQLNELKNKNQQFHIIHFNGHASSNPGDAKSSGVVLQDRLLTTGLLTSVFSKNPAVFCFLNACETTKMPADVHGAWRRQHKLYALASALLETGAYLLGSSWKVEDQTAAKFAKDFYSSFLEGNSLGYSVREARRAARDPNNPNNLGWASYTLYGDPRLYIRKVAD